MIQAAQYVRWVGGRVIGRSAAGGLTQGGVVSDDSCQARVKNKLVSDGLLERKEGEKGVNVDGYIV